MYNFVGPLYKLAPSKYLHTYQELARFKTYLDCFKTSVDCIPDKFTQIRKRGTHVFLLRQSLAQYVPIRIDAL